MLSAVLSHALPGTYSACASTDGASKKSDTSSVIELYSECDTNNSGSLNLQRLVNVVHCCSGLEEVLGVKLPQNLSTDEARDTLAKLVIPPPLSLPHPQTPH